MIECVQKLAEAEIRDFLVGVHEAYFPQDSYEFDLSVYPGKLARCAEGVAVRNVDGRIVALVLGYLNDVETHCAYISYIARMPDATVSGRDLHAAFEHLANKKVMRSIRLEVLKTNVRARAFYDRLGYRMVEDRGSRLLLEKNLV